MLWRGRFECSLYVVRHADTLYIQESAPVRRSANLPREKFPLSAEGSEQSKKVGMYFRRNGIGFSWGFCTTAERSRRTLEEILSEITDPPGITESVFLDEKNEGLGGYFTPWEIDPVYPLQPGYRRLAAFGKYASPRGENWATMEARVDQFLTHLERIEPGGNVILVVHASTAEMLKKVLYSEPADVFERRMTAMRASKSWPDNCSVTAYLPGWEERGPVTVTPWREAPET
jgi:broad specificity phosphatase PhoE